MTGDLPALAGWLAGHGVTHVAMESTGVCRKPVFNVLEGGARVIPVNAEHIKQVPGRKTDVKGCRWIAQLPRHGLLKAGFVPPQPTREPRDRTRQRARLIRERSGVANRARKVPGGANIKLAGVATDALGASGRDMPGAPIAGEADPEKWAEPARGRLREKIPALRLALRGRVTGPHRFPPRVHLDPASHRGGLIGRPGARIEGAPAPGAAAQQRLQTIPGVSRRVAEAVPAEIGTDRGQFPSAGHLASWAGMCSGNQEGAGKRRSGRTTKGDRWLKRIPVQAARAASPTKGTYLAAQYRRLAKRRGGGRALVAVGHTPPVMACHVRKRGATYAEPGADFPERQQPERWTRPLVKRLEALGHEGTPEPSPAA
jgi:transposase